MINKELLEILACPKCKGDISLEETLGGLVCKACGLLYEIRDGIPIMLVDEARPLEDVKKEKSQPQEEIAD
ncbi:Trm112 family protein [Thermosulfuriphilus sp.]